MLQRQFAFTFCICTNLAAFVLCVSAHTHKFSGARIQTLPGYAIASVANLLNSTICGKELQKFRDAVDQRIPWGLKVLDSSGEFKPGFLYGNNYWLGSRSQCLDTMNTTPLRISKWKILNNTFYRDPQKEFPPFIINYYVAHFKYNSTSKYHINIFNDDMITLGLCLPASCAINDLIFILERMFRDKVLLIDDLYSMDFRLIQVKDLKDNDEWRANGALPFVCIALAFSFFMATIGTIYDIFIHQKYAKDVTNKINNGIEHTSKNIEKEINLFSYWKNKIGKMLICFSVYTNTKEIFNIKSDTSTISAIHGLRFLSMCLTIMSHTVFYSFDSLDNKIWLWKYIDNSSEHFFSLITIAVDIYFFSSGCLMTYLFLRNKTNKEQIKPIDCKEKLIDLFVHIIKRFMRLTPTYMMVLGLVQLSSAWFEKTSQFYMHERSHETCSKYWWRNLLYINSLFSFDEMCMSWSWHIANDMQFYVITMTLLIFSSTYFYRTVMILGALLMGSIIFSGYMSYVNQFVVQLTYDERHKFAEIYISPWNRISPYIIGIIAGYILTKVNNYFVLKRKVIILCSCLVIACYIFIFVFREQFLFVLDTTAFIAVFISLHRIFCAIIITWVVIICTTKHGGIVNQFLSFKGWIPFSRLTYGVYLLNPFIIRSFCLYRETSIHFEILPIFVTSVAYILINYFCSYVLFLMMEIPYILLTRMFIQSYNANIRKTYNRKVS